MKNSSTAFFLSLVTGALCLLSACGFQPMYGDSSRAGNASVSNKALSSVRIGNIPDRDGQFLRNALIDRFYQDGRPVDPAYLLSVAAINETIADLDITIESEATRAQLKMATSITLEDAKTREKVLTRSLKSITSYNVLGSQFTTRVSEQDAREAALNDLARQIELQVGLYFNR